MWPSHCGPRSVRPQPSRSEGTVGHALAGGKLCRSQNGDESCSTGCARWPGRERLLRRRANARTRPAEAGRSRARNDRRAGAGSRARGRRFSRFSRLLGVGELVRWPSRGQALGAGGGLLVLALTMLAARRFADTSWPLVHGHPGVLAAAGLLFVLAGALKIYAWRALFSERPPTSDRANARARRRLRGSLGGIRCPSSTTRRRGSGRHRPTVQGLSGECSYPLPIAGHAWLGGRRRSGAPRLGVRGCAGSLGRHAHQHRGRCGCGDRGRRAGCGAAGSRRNQEAAELPARPLVQASHDLVAGCLGRHGRLRVRTGSCVRLRWFFCSEPWGRASRSPLRWCFSAPAPSWGRCPLPPGSRTQAGAGAAGLVASGVGASQAIEVAVAGQTLAALAGIAILVFCLVRRMKTRAPCGPLGERPPGSSILARPSHRARRSLWARHP